MNQWELDCRKTLFRKIKLFSHKKKDWIVNSLDNMGTSLSRLIDLKDRGGWAQINHTVLQLSIFLSLALTQNTLSSLC